MNIGKKIVLVTSGQPSLNPRLVKEADALAEQGYQVTVLYAYWNAWATGFDKQLIPSKKWKAICVAGSPQERPYLYWSSRVIYRLAKALKYDDIAISRPSYFLVREAKKHKADLYIAHNLGAIKAVVAAAREHGAKCGFDAEDFHRNETSDDANSADVRLKTAVEDKYILQLDQLTAASPQIAAAYKKLYPSTDPKVILNVFPKSAVKPMIAYRSKSPLKLFWFSQTIGPDRGIEEVVSALQFLNKDCFELHLLGKPSTGSTQFVDKLMAADVNLKIHEPVHPDEVVSFAEQFDVGLALENKTPYNRDICLTNKIFTYMQAGLAIIASDTKAQKAFVDDNPTIGKIYPKGDHQALTAIILDLYENKERLISLKNGSMRLATELYNWETESLKFLTIVNYTLTTRSS